MLPAFGGILTSIRLCDSSAEEAPEELAEGETQVNNIVHSFRLNETQFDKKSYLTYLKGYMKSVKAKLQETKPDEVAAFEKGAAAFAKKVVANFKDYEFYTGESMDPDGMCVLLNYREDGTTPYMVSLRSSHFRKMVRKDSDFIELSLTYSPLLLTDSTAFTTVLLEARAQGNCCNLVRNELNLTLTPFSRSQEEKL